MLIEALDKSYRVGVNAGKLMVARGRGGIETAPTSEHVAGAGYVLTHHTPSAAGPGPGIYTRDRRGPPQPLRIKSMKVTRMGCEICGMGHSTKHHSDGIEKSMACLAIITRHYVKEPWHLKECELASALKKPMIACVEKGVDWSEYKRFPWVKVIEFDRDHLDMHRIEKELGPILESLGKNYAEITREMIEK